MVMVEPKVTMFTFEREQCYKTILVYFYHQSVLSESLF